LWVGRSAQRRRHNSSSSSSKSGGSGSSGAKEEAPKPSALYTAEFWGALGAVAGWGMGLSGIYDAFSSGPEVISLTMTPVLIVYSSLFVRWALIVNPRNVPLAACHATNVVSQLNQLRRALDYKLQHGQEQQVKDITQKAAFGGACIAGSIVLGPTLRAVLTKNTQLGPVSTIAAADAGPFTVHFWAPMSKWMISGASFFDLYRPTEQISLPQYTALTLTGFFFTPYSLLVVPINYTLCSVNIALFLSSGWHLGRKIQADYLSDEPTKQHTSSS